MPTNAILGYSLSRNYKRLVELARQSSVVCVVDYRVGEGEPIRDIARTQYGHHHDEETFLVAARGTGYIHAFGEDEFIKFCFHSNVEFIEPQPATEVKNDRPSPWTSAVMRAYGHLWHISTDPAAPTPPYSPERAAAEARKSLLPLLSHEQRGEAINATGREIGRYPGDYDASPHSS